MNRSLITRFGGIGDIVLLTPALKALTELNGVAPDLVTGAGWVYPTLRDCPYVHELFILQKRGLPRWLNSSSRSLKRQLRGKTYFNIFNLHPEPRTQRHFDFLGLSSIDPIEGIKGEHESARRLRQCHLSANADYKDLEPWLYTKKTDIDELVKKLPVFEKPCVLVQPGNKKTMKRGNKNRASNNKHWPNEHWQEVIYALLDGYPTLQVVLTGAPSEFEYLQEISEVIHSDRLYNLAKDLNIVELKAASCLAAAMITVDTGPAHIAAAFGCPMIELFGPCNEISHAPLNLGQKMALISKFPEGKSIYSPEIGLIEPSDVIKQFDSVFDFTRSLPYSRLI